MAEAVHLQSLDEDDRRFVPDEVFETVEDATYEIGYHIGGSFTKKAAPCGGRLFCAIEGTRKAG